MEFLPQRQAAVQMVGLHNMILIFSCLNTTIGVRAGVGRVGGVGGGSSGNPKVWATQSSKRKFGQGLFLGFHVFLLL